MLANDVADLTELVGLGLAVDGLDIDEGGRNRGVFPHLVTRAVLTVENETETREQCAEIGKGEIMIPLPGEQSGFQSPGFVHRLNPILLYA